MGIRSTPIYLLSPTPKAGVWHLPMIQFQTIPQSIHFEHFNGLIITSKQGIIALDEISDGAWRQLPVAAIGKMTANAVEKRGGKVLYTASKAYGDILAQELSAHFLNYKWLYPRPKVVVSSIAAHLRSVGVEVVEKVIYETICMHYDETQRPLQGAILIFSSPSIVHCFLKNFHWDPTWRAVAIGQKTAAAFPNYVIPEISPSPSIDETIEFAKNLASY